jgi:nitrite reductase (NADH) large subunit
MRYLIIGNSAAGNAAAAAIRRFDRGGEVLILSAESHPSYYRPLIPHLIDGTKRGDDLLRDPLRTPPDVTVRLNCQVTAVDPVAKAVILTDGEGLGYDRLLLATGSTPIKPAITGLDGPGVFTLRTWDDALVIRRAAKEGQQAVILGGGRVGMKSAFALRALGLEVTVIELLGRIVPQQLDDVGASIFAGFIEKAGIRLRLGQTFREVIHERGKLAGVVLDDGTRLAADLIVVATGVRANVELAQAASLAVGQGVQVDEGMRTSVPGVYAAGDVVETTDAVTGQPIVSGIWTSAVGMGACAGENMAGGQRRFAAAFSLLNAMELGGLPVISVGLIHPPEEDGYQVYAVRRGDTYRKLVLKERRLVGLILINEIERAGVYQTLIREHADVTSFRDKLLSPRFHYGHFVSHPPQEVDRFLAA